MSHRIVICDDEPHITLAVSMKLMKAGFNVEIANDGQGAWEAIQRETPELLITDYQMPRMDGLELCKHVRKIHSSEQLPIFMLTAKGLELDSDGLKAELGINRFILKPFSPRDLLKVVQEILEPAVAAS